jgi:hypothetical protein
MLGGWEAGRLQFDRIEEIKKALSVLFNAELLLIPGFEGYPGPEVFHLEPVFNING